MAILKSELHGFRYNANATLDTENSFYNAWSSSYPVNLTIGEDVEVVNTNTFGKITINHLQYNAKDVSPTTTASTSNSPFNGTAISSFALGNTVKKINKYTFYNIKLTQEDLIIPDSVTYIGSAVFNNSTPSNLVFTNLYIGSGLQEIELSAFGTERTFTNIYIDALHANDDYKSTNLTDSTNKKYLPIAENVHIHINSDFYYYFAAKATNVVSYCVDHMTESIGEEYLDESTAQYVTPTYNTCEICEYQTTAYAYEDAFIVDFYVDGILYHTAYAKNGASVEAPTDPVKEGYNFTGWDADFSNISDNMTINAQFEIKTYTVTFKDYDGTVLETQTIAHGGIAFEPAEPTREGYTFKAWDKDYSNITENLTVTAVYEKNHVHEYSEETERKDATCVEKGYVISKCSCGDTEKTELDIVPDNHTGETEVKDQKAATCKEKGYTGDTYCKSCDTKIKDGTETDLAEHTPGETK